MTKKFDVIPVEDYYVVVDRNESNYDKVGWWCYMDKFIGGTCVIDDNRISFKDSQEGIHTLYKDKEDHKYLCKIIATINKRIENLPLIELPYKNGLFADEDDELYCACPGNGSGDTPENAIYCDGWVEGYKAAQSEGRYSEEDMEKCYEEGRLFGKHYSDEYTHNTNKLFGFQPKTYPEYIQSLRKKNIPIAVELEIQTYNPPEEGYFSVHKHLRVKITHPDTSTIIPKEVYYE